jgi:hypothetical protein
MNCATKQSLASNRMRGLEIVRCNGRAHKKHFKLEAAKKFTTAGNRTQCYSLGRNNVTTTPLRSSFSAFVYFISDMHGRRLSEARTSFDPLGHRSIFGLDQSRSLRKRIVRNLVVRTALSSISWISPLHCEIALSSCALHILSGQST